MWRNGPKRSACQHAHKPREWSARTKCIQKLALCATSSFMLREVTAPKCSYQARVFQELNASSVELPSPLARFRKLDPADVVAIGVVQTRSAFCGVAADTWLRTSE